MDVYVKGDAEDWNGSRPVDVRAVVMDVIRQFSRHLEQNPLPSVVFLHPGSPLTRHLQAGDDPRSVYVHCSHNDWSRLSYEFAHELCHLLTVPDRLMNSKNNWFVESICELASVFAIRSMSKSWVTHPPYGHWANYAKSLETYAQKHIDGMGKLARGQTLKHWLAENETALRGNPIHRRLNHVTALALLPLFESSPGLWNALQYLPSLGENQSEYLRFWHQYAPVKHRQDIAAVAREFGVTLA